MTEDFDAHVRSGIQIGEDRYIHLSYWTGRGEISLPADKEPEEGWVLIGLHEDHKKKDGFWCGGYVHFKNVPEALEADKIFATESKHELISENPLTVEPSLQCRGCPSHGHIREGRWTDA